MNLINSGKRKMEIMKIKLIKLMKNNCMQDFTSCVNWNNLLPKTLIRLIQRTNNEHNEKQWH